MSQEQQEDGGLDLSADAPLPEEASPYDPSIEDRPILYVQLVDASLSPCAGVEVVVSGDGLPEERTVTTDDSGELLIEDCGPGLYRIEADGKQGLAHTLSQRDLEQDESAYRVLLSEPSENAEAAGAAG